MARESSENDPARNLPPLRHWGGFLLAGLIALSSDALLLQVGILALGLSPLIARLVAISGAMVAGWLAHRRLTFSLTSPPTLWEFTQYSATAWAAAAINYAVFAAVLFVSPGTHPLAALVLASILATFFAYMGMRYRVFRGRT
ncbi:MAG: GtrA family protein [Hyphomicrobium sp.]|nr:GtrA family protein [Hyphomicrobium sp.]